mmetsp:Transcript_24144/g.27338  ORF Transcript_24144/g.27338 Transcript_24144/m.27338 type:complete len:211 (-) Transcript_24144:201-833(-)
MQAKLRLVAFIALVVLTQAGKKDEWKKEKIPVVLSWCYDGDTCTVQIPDPDNAIPKIFKEDMKVRLSGIDTPEKSSRNCMLERCLAEYAKKLLTDTVKDAVEVYLSDNVRDKYFRINSNLYYRYEGETDFHIASDILLEGQLAVKYGGGTKEQDWCDYTGTAFYHYWTDFCLVYDKCVQLEVERLQNEGGFITSKGECNRLLKAQKAQSS